MKGPGSLQALTIASRLFRNLPAISSPVRFWFARQKPANIMRLHRLPLRPVVANPGVLHEHDPVTAASQSEPVVIRDALVGRDAVVLCQGGEAQPGSPQQQRNLDAPQAAVEEEVRQPVGMRHAGRPRGDPRGRQTRRGARRATRRPRSAPARPRHGRRLARRPEPRRPA
jgi:hypothetical protein